jgi:hypothetical protein
MKKHEKTLAPRLPIAVREKIKSGGSHQNKKAYKRQAKHRDRDVPSVAFY